MDTKEKLLESIEERLTVYAGWINQGQGRRSKGSEDLYRELLNTAFDYELRNMNWEKDNFPAIDLGDAEERLAVQVTSTGTADKVKKTLEKFKEYNLDQDYDRLIVLVAGKAECKPEKFKCPGLELQIWGTVELVEELRRLSLKKLREVDEFLRERVDAPTMKKPVLHLPMPERRSPVGFLGRKTELAWIGDELKKDTKPMVIAGLGGVGKTALAVEFKKQHWPHGNVYFVRFEGSFTGTLAYGVGGAIPPQDRGNRNEEALAELALEYLGRCTSGDLLIVDNAEVAGKSWAELTKDPFYEKIRRLPMAVLMTTRHRDTGGLWLGNLDREDLRDIFRRHQVAIPVPEMDALIDAVGGHTMTVDMVARTIHEGWGQVRIADILAKMKDSTLDQGAFDEITNDHDPEQRKIYAHLRALFDLTGIGGDGRHALRCASLLPPGGLAEAVFISALPEGPGGEIKKLEKLGWVNREDGIVTIHPVVRLVCRTELGPTDWNCWDFLRGVNSQYDEKVYDHQKYTQMAELFTEASNTLEDRTGFWAYRAGWLWNKLVQSQRALECNLRSVEKDEKHQPNSKNLAASYGNVGKTYGALGDHAKALEYALKALEIREKVLPENNPDLAISYNNVGCTYDDSGDHSKALEYKLKALGICEKVLPKNHPDVAITYNSVGVTYSNLGDHAKGLEYKLKALGIQEKILPENNPDLAISYNNVGCTYGELGDHAKALEYQQKALGIREKVLPENHPGLARSYNNVGGTYRAMGNLEKALEYAQKALGIRKRVLPENHPDLARSYNNVACTYYDMGQLRLAAEYMRRAAEVINRSSLPEGHTDRVKYNKWADRLERELRDRGDE